MCSYIEAPEQGWRAFNDFTQPQVVCDCRRVANIVGDIQGLIAWWLLYLTAYWVT